MSKVFTRFQTRFENGEFYEAHQMLRTIITRLVKSHKPQEAIDLLYKTIDVTLKHSQFSISSDLILYLLEILNESKILLNDEIKSQFIKFISLFNPLEPSLKQIGVEIINYSIKSNPNEKFGDSDLHYQLGLKFIENPQLIYDGERHLILSQNPNSFKTYLDLIWNWYLQSDTEVERYISRIVLNYLYIHNIKNARLALSQLIDRFINHKPDVKPDEIVELDHTFQIFQELPLLNFLQLLIITIQTSNKSLYLKLIEKYQSTINSFQYKDVSQFIGEAYFQITPQRSTNLMDLIGGFF